MKPKRMRTALVGAILGIAVLQGQLANAAGPYDSASVNKGVSRDLLGRGGGAADGTADTDGRLTATVSASSDAPAGTVAYGYAVGGNTAFAYPTITDIIGGVTSSAGVSVALNVAAISASGNSSGQPYLYGTDSGYVAYVTAYALAYFYPCAQGEYCNYTSSAFGYKQISSTGATSIPLELAGSGPGHVSVITYIAAVAQATGSGSSAQASVDATVSSITVS